MSRLTLVLSALALLTSPAAALEVPLTVAERAGVDRVDNHVYGGVPLPEGAAKDVDKFVLVDAAGKAVPAQFVVRERWLKDDSVRHMTVHFRADLKAGETAKFTVSDSEVRTGKPVAMPPLDLTEAADSVAIDTGAVKFTIKKGDWHLFDSVDMSGKALLKSPGKVLFKAEYGKTPVENERAKAPELGEFKDAVPVVKSFAVEEKGPGRVVVLVKGAFQEGGADKLDFQARYYAVAGSSSVRVAFTIVNRQGKAFDEFVGIRQLGFELPLALDGEKKFALGASEGEDLSGALGAGDKVAMLQPSSLEYVVSGKAEAKGKCKELLTKRVGWLSLAGSNAAVTAAVRWFWQLHPKGLEAAGDGTLKVWLVPLQEKKVEVPAEEYSEPIVRIDLYTGGAKTHDLLFAFHKPGPAGAADARGRAMGGVEPLFAACSPEWYCQKTFAFDRMYDARLENYRPEARELIRKYETSVDRALSITLARMSGKARKDVKIQAFLPITAKDKDGNLADTVWCSAQKVEEYGCLNFGGHAEQNDLCKQNDALNTRWDGNYYDVPRACLVRYLRTGMWHAFEAAEQAGLHLADIDICHWHPGDQKLNGIEHTCPNRGHFRQWWPGEKFGVSGNVDSAKSQSLFELYCLTGDMWYREAGLLSGDYLVGHGGSALRAQGNRMTGLYSAWKSSRDEKYRKVWADQVKATTAMGLGKGGDKGWDQFWMYGLAAEGLFNYSRATGELDAAKAAVTAADSLMFCDVNKTMGKGPRGEYDNLAGFTVNCPGYAYELTGDAKYLKYGLKRLDRTGDSSPGRSKSFAQHARISPQFLFYLASDYQPPKPVVGEKAAADAAEQAIKEYAAEAAAAPGPEPAKK
ncbi:MAG TPA: hypothetical protein PK280_05125 [Planctomycetota bacterium]|nr:hypothetical protein [Planctomycetota bacterium]